MADVDHEEQPPLPPGEEPAGEPAPPSASGGEKSGGGDGGQEGAIGSRGEGTSEERRRDRSRSKELRRDRSRSRERRHRSRSRERKRSSRWSPKRRSRSRSRDRHRDRERRRSRSRERRRHSRSRSRDRRRHSRSRSPIVPPLPTRPIMVAPPGGIMPALPGALPMANPLLANPLLMPGLPGGTAVAGLSQATRKSRELYIGGLPIPCFDYQLQTFLNQALVALGLVRATGKMPVIKCEISPGGAFAFVEFGEIMDCTAALALDGIPFMGTPLRIARPKEYQTPLGAPPDPQPLGAGTIAALLSKQETNPETAALLLSSTGAPPGTAPAQAASLMAGLGGPQAPAGMPVAPGLPPQVAAINPATRKQRELYIGGLPIPCADIALQSFLNQTLTSLGLVTSQGRPPVVKVAISPGGAYAFVEFAEIGDATCALVLDGIPFQGCPLKIKRPKEYVPPYGAPADPQPLGPAALAALMEQQKQGGAGGGGAPPLPGGPPPPGGGYAPQPPQPPMPPMPPQYPGMGPTSGGGGANWP